MNDIDPNTNRLYGDHGTALEALTYALDIVRDTFDSYDFLLAWRYGDLQEWPEYYIWLNNQ